MKIIYIEPDEEIISVIDKIDRSNVKQIGVAIPKNAQIWQSSINLKLLKREADDSNKKVILVVADDFDSNIAENIGFEIKKVNDVQVEPDEIKESSETENKEIEEPEEEPEKSSYAPEGATEDKPDMLQALVNEMESESTQEFRDSFKEASLAGYRKKSSGKMAKIINSTKFFNKKKIKKAKKKQTNFKELSSVWTKFFIGFVAVVAILAGFVIYFVLPSAKITIYPQIETVSFDLSIIGSKNISEIDADLNQVPLQEIKVEKTINRKFEATGEKDLSEKATGIISIYNEYSSSPQTLVATTRFQSPDGIIFRIPKNIIVPGAKIENAKIIPSFLDVEVEADQPGPDFNIGPSDFTIPGFKGSPKYVGFYGKSSESMSGGSIGKAKIVLDDDLIKAEQELSDELLSSAKLSLQKQIPDGFEMIDNGINQEIIKTKFSAEVDEQADSFNLEIKGEARALFFQKQDLQKIIDLNLLNQIDEDKKMLSDTQEFDWQESEIDWNADEASLSLFVQENIASNINVDILKSDLSGKDEIEARKYFTTRPEIERAQFSFWPFWVKSIPTQLNRIKINVDYGGE